MSSTATAREKKKHLLFRVQLFGMSSEARKEAGGDVCRTKAGGGRLVVVFV